LAAQKSRSSVSNGGSTVKSQSDKKSRFDTNGFSSSNSNGAGTVFMGGSNGKRKSVKDSQLASQEQKNQQRNGKGTPLGSKPE